MSRHIVIYLILLLPLNTILSQPSYENYHLVWSDEFDVDGLPSPSNWGYEQGCSVRNDELQYYARAREENSRVENGNLIIEARREQMDGCAYTSASLITSGKKTFQYGIFEIRAKIDVRKGSWPAFWTLGVSQEWPSNGEVDIMEYYNGSLHANVAWGTDTRWQAKWDSQTKSVGSSFSDDFHVWRMHWTEDFIDLWVDDFKQNTTDLSTTINGSLATLRNPFHQKVYIVINQAVGSNGGDPSNTDFPIQYIIDYVRVYQEGADTTSPRVTSVTASADGIITIQFSEGINSNKAEVLSNYLLGNTTAKVSAAELQNDRKTVTLTAEGIAINETVQITIKNIEDNAIPANIIHDTVLSCIVLPPSKKLSGAIIGNGDPWDGNTGIEFNKAVDGNISTYSDCINDPVWVGYDFGTDSNTIITELRYYPRDGYADRMSGMSFEISDDGVEWTKLYTIKSTPTEGIFTSAIISSETPSRFVRYNGTGGYLNVAEVEFYGYTTASTKIGFDGKNLHLPNEITRMSFPLSVTAFSLDGKQLYSNCIQNSNALVPIDKILRNNSHLHHSGIVILSFRSSNNLLFQRKMIIR